MKIQKNEFLEKGSIPIIDQSQKFISGYTNNINSKISVLKPLIIFGDHTCSIKYIDFDFSQGADGIKIIETNDDLNSKYLYYNLYYKPILSDGYKRHFLKLKNYKIPLPPLEIQEQIVGEIDNYQKEIENKKQEIINLEKKIKDKIGEVWGENISL